MTEEEAGRLLMERKVVREQIATLMQSLTGTGKVLQPLISKLQDASQVERITFSNAPGELGQHPLELIHEQAIDWQRLPEWSALAQQIQQLRVLRKKERQVEEQLRGAGLT